MSDLKPIVDGYNEEESFMYKDTYLFIRGYATAKRLYNTLKMLPLARRLHDGQHRKGVVKVGDKEYRLPYVSHVLTVCATLIDLELPLPDHELDILLTVALGHDLIEDCDFRNGGEELVTEYKFPQEVYQTIKLLSKRHGATEEELSMYFNEIKKNKYALLVKMSDRSHNVEDLYNMKIEKLHKYIAETRTWIYPLSSYAKANYPELSSGVTLLKSKIVSVTEDTEALVAIYDEKIAEKDKEISALQSEIVSLRNESLICGGSVKSNYTWPNGDVMTVSDAYMVLRTRVSEKDLDGLAPDVKNAIMLIREACLERNVRS